MWRIRFRLAQTGPARYNEPPGLSGVANNEVAMISVEDLAKARAWLAGECHDAHLRTVLQRCIEYAEAVDRAGLCIDMVNGDDLHDFLADEAVTEAVPRHFTQATM
jgi:hypothetical protein